MFEEQSRILIKANEQLENDLLDVARQVSSFKYGYLIWACTYREIRHDAWIGVIKEYFRKEGGRLETSCADSGYFKELLSPLRVLRHWLAGLIRSPQSVPKGLSWFRGGRSGRHRYREIVDWCKPEERVFFSPFGGAPEMSGSEVTLDIRRLARVSDILISLVIAFQVRRRIGRLQGSTFVVQFIRNMPWTQIFAMAIRELWIDRAIKHYQPSIVFFATANTYPPARLTARCARNNGVTFVVVSCRGMLMPTRSEDRLALVDFEANRQAPVTDYWIVWDRWSRDMLVEFGADKNSVFLVGSSMPDPSETIAINSKFVLLLSHDEKLNASLIDLWIDCLPDNAEFVLRTHPNCRLTSNQAEQLNQHRYDDISGTPMEQIRFSDCIAVTIHSTSAIEAAGRGCGVVWIPFIFEESLLLAPAMSAFGTIAEYPEDLFETLRELAVPQNRQKLIVRDTGAFKEWMCGQDQTVQAKRRMFELEPTT